MDKVKVYVVNVNDLFLVSCFVKKNKKNMEISARVVAIKWAAGLDVLDSVKDQDRPYVEAALVAASLIERPAPKLQVSVLDTEEDHYDVTVKGYTRLMDDDVWYDTFRGPDRPEELTHVIKTYSQMVGGVYIKVLKIRKVQFSRSVNKDRRDGRRVIRKRRDGR